MSDTKYSFWIELYDNQEVRWSGLSLRQVQNLHHMTEKRMPNNVRAFGWEEEQDKLTLSQIVARAKANKEKDND